jgi:hypothetical protein
MAHELAEQLAGLASRVNNLAVNHTGDDSRTFFDLQNQLIDLSEKAILADLDNEAASYGKALDGLNAAIKFIGEAEDSIANVSQAIQLITKAVGLAEKAIGAAAKV